MESEEMFAVNSEGQLASIPSDVRRLSIELPGLHWLPEAIVQLSGLQELQLLGCSSLAALPESLGQLSSLQQLDLRDCSSLAALPESLGQLSGLQQLQLLGCSRLAALPESLGQLSGLQQLQLLGCSRLAALPESLGQLSRLQQLDLRGCSSLVALPESLGQLSGLQQVVLRYCSLLSSLPESLGQLSSLQQLGLLDCRSLSALPESLGQLSGLQQLDLSGCDSLAALPESFGQLSGLQQLDLWGCDSLAALPESLGRLSGLQQVVLRDCSLLSSLPESLGQLSSLQLLDLHGCDSLAALPESLGQLSRLPQLYLSGCSSLAALPESLGQLSGLQQLDLTGCSSLAALPESFGQLSSLQQLYLTGCSQLSSLPESIGLLTGLRLLDLSNSGLRSLPKSFEQLLPRLEAASILGCSELEVSDYILSQLRAKATPVEWRIQQEEQPGQQPQQREQPLQQQQQQQEEGAPPSPPQQQEEQVQPEKAAEAAIGGGNDDRPAVKDTLGILPVAKGTAQFLLHPGTAATTLAVYGCWGSGKSTFMKLVEGEMLLQAAAQQRDDMEPGGRGPVHDHHTKLLERRTAEDWQQLQALANPRLLTVWFNSWQYLNEEQVWSGLVVEVTQRLEEKLGSKQRRLMRAWWIVSFWAWLRLLLTPMRLLAAVAYNWKARRMALVLRCFLPLLLVLAVVAVCVGVGIRELHVLAAREAAASQANSTLANATQVNATLGNATLANSTRNASAANGTDDIPRQEDLPVNKSAVAAVAAAGVLTGLLAAVVAALTNCKQISDTLVEGRAYWTFKDHSNKIGYQHTVIKDIRLLARLIHKAFTPFTSAGAAGSWLGALVAAPAAVFRAMKRAAAILQLWCCVRRHRAAGPGLIELSSEPEGGEPRIVVFIDDLDRCKPNKIIEVLEAINLVLAGSGFAVVVGMDKGFIVSAIQNAYKDVDAMADEAKAAEFLEKIVQVELTLPSPAKDELSDYLKAQGVVLSMSGVTIAGEQQGSTAAGPATGTAAAGTAVNRARARAESDMQRAAAAAAAAAEAAAVAAEEAVAAAEAAVKQAAAAATAVAAAAAAAEVKKQAWPPEARKAVGLAKERSAEAATSASQARTALGASDNKKAERLANQAQEAAAAAISASNQARARAESARQRQAGGDPVECSHEESRALSIAHARGLLLGSTPRNLKRLLNRYLLTKYIFRARGSFNAEDERELMAWVLLSWRYPLGMAALAEFKSKGQPADWSDLGELIMQLPSVQQLAEQQTRQPAEQLAEKQIQAEQQTQPESMVSGSRFTAEQLDLDKMLQAARVAGDKAKADVTAAADADAKKGAVAAAKQAERQLQIAQVLSLCVSSARQVRQLFNLRRGAVERYHSFGVS